MSRGELLVIKIGGGKTINLEAIIADLKFVDQQYLVVHGAHALRDEIAQKLGHEVKTITSVSGYSSVLTDDDAMDIFMMTYAGLRNKRLVEMAQKYGINAIGLTGLDGRLIQGKRKTAIKAKMGDRIKVIRNDLSGRPEKLNVELLQSLISSGYVPFITPPILSYEGQALNTDNDSIVALLVKELGNRVPKLSVEVVIHLLEAPGLLKDPRDPNTLITTIKKVELEHIEKDYTQGRMKRKMLAVRQAFDYGAKKIIFADGRIEQ
ncbi:[LysW]-aminoadipate kinase, partial [Patescibacteria group bacterium AH-259-L07]|nr:[LysW]-aminoadipate kinase [Patescibacteria group bacterium AH-259-L07]